MNKPANILIKEFLPNLEKPSAKWYAGVAILSVIALFGVYALIRQMMDGQIITGMRDNAVWGIYTANFVFFMGLSYAGALVSCSFQLLRIKWAKPILRMAELLTVSSLIVGAPFILFCLGRLDRIHLLLMNGRIQSPITWDVIAISTDLVFCIAFLYFTHIRDFAKLRDADLLLGRLDEDNFAGGDIKLSIENAAIALKSQIGNKLDMNAETAAIGICEVVDENMANAARVHAVESGKELAGFTMIAFGGAAPLHASRLCEKLNIDSLLIPPGAGVGSAIGFLRAPFGFEAVRGAFLKLSRFDPDWTNALIQELGGEAERFARAGTPDGELNREIKAYMRYEGQGWEIVVNLPKREFVDGDDQEIRRLFEDEYRRLFGRSLEGLDIEIMNWSVQASSPLAAVEPVKQLPNTSTLKTDIKRNIFDAREQIFVEAGVYERESMEVGNEVTGPAIIVENETTTIVTSGYKATMQQDRCLLMQRKNGGGNAQ